MTFATLPWAGVLAGLAALAAALFALQQLRTRYRDVTVVTTLFWKQVIDEAPVRKFRERFRHPWAYLLILAVCSLIWLAFAEPRAAVAADGAFHVLVLDGSAGMAAGNRFASAVGLLERYLSRVPADRRQVIWSGGELRPLLAPGEHDLLLRKRLERLAPEPAPASVERLLRQVGAASRDGRRTSVVVFGDAPVRKPVIDLLPAGVTVARAAAPTPLTGNAGITAVGVADAASGAWDRVDVLVSIEATADRAASAAGAVDLTLDGRPVPAAAMTRTADRGGVRIVVRDLPAAGGVFAARLTGPDALAPDDQASVRLPDRPVLKVQVSASLERILGPVLRADAGVSLVAAGADVVVRRSGEAAGGDAPALEFVPAGAQAQAFLLVHPDALESDAVFEEAVRDIGLTQIDAMSLARETGRPIEVSIATGPTWRFSVWDDLLSEHYNFTRSRAFPLFVANSLRWLAGTQAWYPVAAAGRPLLAAAPGAAARIVDLSGRAIDPIGAAFVPPRAGDLRLAGSDRPIAVSLSDPDATRGVRDASMAVAALAPADAGSGADLSAWLVALAIALLGLEWYLFQRGRLP
jgi:hypothetical protein